LKEARNKKKIEKQKKNQVQGNLSSSYYAGGPANVTLSSKKKGKKKNTG